MTDPQAVPYRVLVVCTGNICRSPFAERLLRDSFARIGAALGAPAWSEAIEVSSAGTHAVIGRPIEAPMAALLAAQGSAGAVHAARQLDRDLVDGADLVLALTRHHRRDVVRLLPNASRRVFALNEFARLLVDADEAGILDGLPSVTPRAAMAAIVEAAASRRGFAPAPDDPAEDDVIDPYGRDASVYQASAAYIAAIVGRMEATIRGVAGAAV